MRKQILFLLTWLFSVSLFSAQPEKYDWFFVNYTSYKHKIHIEINGKKHISIEDEESGFDSQPTPLKEGKNQILVRFEQRPEKTGKPGLGSKARILLSPTMMVGAKPLPGVEITEVENYCECKIEVLVKDEIPQSFTYVRKDWASDKKKVLLYEEQVEKKAFSEIWDKEQYKSWTEDGAPFREECYLKGKLDSAKY